MPLSPSQNSKICTPNLQVIHLFGSEYLSHLYLDAISYLIFLYLQQQPFFFSPLLKDLSEHNKTMYLRQAQPILSCWLLSHIFHLAFHWTLTRYCLCFSSFLALLRQRKETLIYLLGLSQQSCIDFGKSLEMLQSNSSQEEGPMRFLSGIF